MGKVASAVLPAGLPPHSDLGRRRRPAYAVARTLPMAVPFPLD